jgi:hypothetical protein
VETVSLVPEVVPDRISVERVSLPVSETDSPILNRVHLEYVDADGRRVPLVTRNRYPVGVGIDLAQVKVIPRVEPRYDPQERTDARLGEAIRLLGYDLPLAEPAPGDTLHLALYWGVDAPPQGDYTVFVHLLGQDGVPVAQGDARPDGGNYPTSMWEAGERIRDAHAVPIPGGVNAGSYRLGVGLYLPETLERLPAYDAWDSRLAADMVLLSEVSVREP